jgi:hypothetical protein
MFQFESKIETTVTFCSVLLVGYVEEVVAEEEEEEEEEDGAVKRSTTPSAMLESIRGRPSMSGIILRRS